MIYYHFIYQEYLSESSKIEKTLRFIKEKIIEMEKGESLYLCFNADEEKIDNMTSLINQAKKIYHLKYIIL